MILTPEQRYKAEHGMDVDSSDLKRGAIRFGLWPRGVVVYAIDTALCKYIVKTFSAICPCFRRPNDRPIA